MTPQRYLSIALVLLALPAVQATALAQDAPELRLGAARATREVLFPVEPQAAVASPQPAGATPQWVQEHRACESCPPRRVGHAFLQTTYLNVVYGLANLIRGQVTARVTPKTWWDNMEQGWVWDLDDFGVNQIGHPYQGSNYFTAARANGLSFWESAGITAFGSGTWEFYGETNHASMNDLINTTLGGMAIGEMLHRTAWLLRDPQATGRGRTWNEIGATVIDPLNGANRFINGDASRVTDKPPDMVPTRLGGTAAGGVLWRGVESGAFTATGEPFLELDMIYGEPTGGRSRTPYDAFALMMRLGGGSPISEGKIRGRLLGEPFAEGKLQLNVSQAYDFNKNNAYQFGAQSFNTSVAYTAQLSSNYSLWMSGWGGLTVLGAVDSIPLGGVAEPKEDPEEPSGGQGVSEGPRYYDYGPGGNYGGWVQLSRNSRPMIQFIYDAHHLYSLDGVRANHFLQQLRLDFMLPVTRQVGLGVAGEYFDRRTYYKEAANDTRKFHFPQIRAFLTWRMS